MNKLYTAQEVADKLKIKKTTVYELIKRGELYSSKIGKQLRVSEEQLDQYLHQSQQAADSNLRLPDTQPESSLLKRDYLLHSSGLILSGQTSPALALLLSQMAVHPDGLPVLQSHMNSYNGLYALYFEKAHIASASLDLEDVQSLVPGLSLSALHLYTYPIGLYIEKGNPKNITGFSDLIRDDVILANREKGSTRRIYLDRQLQKSRIHAANISGYHNEMVSDVSTAAAIVNRKADVAVGEQYIALQSRSLDFLPLEQMPMYLIMETASLEKPGFSALVDIVRSEDFKTSLFNQTGYDVSRSGELIHL